uniref:Uncharacterized protein n=1 Tax=Panagrolaimus sp. JU765 TaxID=591449 RepID=A0AC34Q0M8_9BILA
MGSTLSTSTPVLSTTQPETAVQKKEDEMNDLVEGLDSDQVLLALSAQRGEFKDEETTNETSNFTDDIKPKIVFKKNYF